MTKIYNEKELDILSNILRNDRVICVPTDTVYGLCSRICSFDAYNNLVNIKNRPKDKLFPIMCKDKNQIKSIAITYEIVEKIIDTFMPGPITLILKLKDNLPFVINDNASTVAVRMRTSNILGELIEKVGCPLYMTSANISGKATCITIDEINETFSNLDGILKGDVTYGMASTIIDCTNEELKLIRKGPITIKQIENVIGKKI